MCSAILTRPGSLIAVATLVFIAAPTAFGQERSSSGETRRVKATRPGLLAEEGIARPIGKGVANATSRTAARRPTKVRTVQAEMPESESEAVPEAGPLPAPSRKSVMPNSPGHPQSHGASVPEIMDDWLYGNEGFHDAPGCDNCQLSPCYADPCRGLWVEGQYLSWWLKNASSPPLITTSPAGTALANAGRLGLATTSVLVGGDSVADQQRNGYRAALGYWFSECNAIEVSYFQLADDNQTITQASNGTPILARPFYNVNTVAADAALIAFPNVATGSYQVQYESQMQGGEALLRHLLFQDCMSRWDMLLGYRTLTLDEQLSIDDNVLGGPGSAAPNARIIQRDIFRTENEFNGAQLGLSGNIQRCRWTLQGLMKVGIGNTQSVVNIAGSTTTVDANGAVANGPGGVLALPSNIGRYEQNKFTVIPEIDVTLAYNVTPCLRATIGYTLIFWGNVCRPGDQIDLAVNPNQFFPPQQPVGLLDPSFAFNSTSFWAQGINAGLEYRF